MTDAIILAPAVVTPDYDAGDLLAIAGFPADVVRVERGNAIRRWQRAGWVAPFGLRLSGVAFAEPATRAAEARRLHRAVGGWSRVLTLQAAAEELGWTADGEPVPRWVERVVEAGVEAGWLLPLRAVVLTRQGLAMVEADAGALEVVEAERRAVAAARDLGRLTERERQQLGALRVEDPAVRLARALLGEPVRRAAAGESRDVRGPPSRVQWTPRGSPGAHVGKVS